jgi:hypothetical protein
MSDAKFYQVLGVKSTASADEIKSAYRELVKRYHPDLFHSASAKAKATEKLRQINEAYGVLGNSERRRRYDQASEPKPQTPPRRPASAERGQTAAPRRPARPQPPPFKIPSLRWPFSKKWAAVSAASVALIGIFIFAGQDVPRLATAWVLLEKLEVSLPNMASRDGADTGWIPVAEYGSVSDCAAAIKHKVRQDELEGSEAVYDERHGTMAITLFIRKEHAPAQAPTETAQSAQGSVTKRVRSLECRVSQRVHLESRFRRTLRSMGFFL